MTNSGAVAAAEQAGGPATGGDPRAAESEVRAALELMPQLVWTTTPDGYHDYYNQRWYEFTGMPQPGDPAADEEGWNWNRYLHPDDFPRTVQAWSNCLRTGDPYEIEYRFKEKATGGYRWFLARALPRRDADGRIVRWFGTCTDIHEAKVTRDQLREAQKLEAVGRLAGGVAHDFNNLLAAILGYVDILMADLPDPRARADLDGIRTAAERGARLTAQLLTFGRRHLRRVVAVDLGTAVAESAALVRQFAGPHIHVLIDSAPGSWVRVDPSEIDQVLINLVVNARDAMATGGSLHIAVTRRELVAGDLAGALPGTLAPGAYVELTVTDTGSGIADDVLPRIFEPFFTTKVNSGGGLGLATVYGIAAQSKGMITVDTEVGRGTRFSVLLPADPTARAAEETAQPAVTEGWRVATVLLVEDESALRDVCKRILERKGHRVIAARHGRDGLACWARDHAAIDLVVTDLVMPELGGREMVATIREARAELPVIFMSGYTDDEIMRRALDEPGLTFLAKPFVPDALLSAVQECLRTAPPKPGS